jgi:hypothetical protein
VFKTARPFSLLLLPRNNVSLLVQGYCLPDKVLCLDSQICILVEFLSASSLAAPLYRAPITWAQSAKRDMETISTAQSKLRTGPNLRSH